MDSNSPVLFELPNGMLVENPEQILPAIIEENKKVFLMQPSNRRYRYPEYRDKKDE